MRYFREAMTPVEFLSLGGELRKALIEGSDRLSSLAPISPAAVGQMSDHHFVTLRHELSAHFVALNLDKPDHLRSEVEAEALHHLQGDPEGLGIARPNSFRERLAALNRSLTDGAAFWRNAAIRLSGDKAGNRVFFPPVAAVPAQLEKVRLLLADGAAGPPLFKAAVAYALLLNCHPFSDGNGRTARVLFNHVLRQGGMPKDVYLPLYEIGSQSRGGYEIALRTAELRGDWEPFLRYLLDAIQCCREIAGSGPEAHV